MVGILGAVGWVLTPMSRLAGRRDGSHVHARQTLAQERVGPRRGGREVNTVQPLVVPTITFPRPSTATHRPLGVHDTPVSEPAPYGGRVAGGEE
jgi:hypothetical protein